MNRSYFITSIILLPSDRIETLTSTALPQIMTSTKNVKLLTVFLLLVATFVTLFLHVVYYAV
ncbi:hypothetical protein [Vibrio gallaecicus]|uniref:hypothetical protein n=1 Tax=Vibrio gallaecicus TaxID=552386 RepID=UPI0025B4EA5F|nr:hypothetical protein [Vibrio gallaecicus]MDN3616042.1 hypothetical protein [Vibrio gallaecicus]